MAIVTAKDFITDALLKLGVVAIGETPSADEINAGMNSLVGMLDTWQTEDMSIFTVQPNVMAFDGRASGVYTVGTGGDANISRPPRFTYITIRNSAGQDFPCEILSVQRFQAIVDKSVQSSLPYQCYPDMQYPLCNTTFYPVPSDSSYSAVFWTPQLLTSPTALTTSMLFPPGYLEPIGFNLAARMGPGMQIPVSQDIKDFAISTKASLKRSNLRIPVMVIDPMLTKQTGYTQQDFLAGK